MDLKYKILAELEYFIPACQYNTGSHLLLFTTNYHTDELINFLNDDFNFETTLRLLNLKDQLSVRSQKTDIGRFKLLISKLFSKLVLNYILYIYEANGEFEPWKDLDFTYNKFGKPYLIQQEKYQFQFSMSSSNDMLCIVVELNTSTPIGVDLSHSKQAISPTNFLEQFKPIFDPVEELQLSEIKDLNYRYTIFNQVWTLKEAFTKLLGSGLNIDLSKFYFDINKAMVNEKMGSNFKGTSMISKFGVDWREEIYLNIDKLIEEKNPFLEQLSSTHFKCRSGTLLRVSGGFLPVIVSIINQNNKCVPQNFNINFNEILSAA